MKNLSFFKQAAWIICIFILAGCSNDQDVVPDDSPSALIAKTWKVTQFDLLIDGQTKKTVYKTGSEDNFLGIAEYKFSFKQNGIFTDWTIDTQGKTLQQKGTWVLTDNNSILQLTHEDKTIEQFKIISLSKSEFIMEREDKLSARTEFTQGLFYLAALLNLNPPTPQYTDSTIGMRLKMIP